MGFKRILDAIVDVETIDVYAPQYAMANWNRSIFNVGITAVERVKRDIIFAQQIGVEKIWGVGKRYIKDFYRKNFTRGDFERMFVTFKEFGEWFNGFDKDQSKDYIIYYWSYNAMFDRGAFEENAKREGVEISRHIIKDWKCIMILAMEIIKDKHSVQYANWIVETAYTVKNNKDHILEYITPKGNMRTTAQVVYRFIMNDPSFIELHKGLQDTQCEAEILKWCQAHKGWTKYNMSPGMGWSIVNSSFKRGEAGHLQDEFAQLTYTNREKFNELFEIITNVTE